MKPTYTTKQKILDTAYLIAKELGLQLVSQNIVSNRAGVYGANMIYHYKSIENLRTEVVKKALEMKDYKIVGQAIALNLPYAQRLPLEIRRLALESLL